MANFFPFFVPAHTHTHISFSRFSYFIHTKQIRLPFEKNNNKYTCDFVHNKIPFFFFSSSPFNIMIFVSEWLGRRQFSMWCWWWFHILVCRLHGISIISIYCVCIVYCSTRATAHNVHVHFLRKAMLQCRITAETHMHGVQSYLKNHYFCFLRKFRTALKWFGAMFIEMCICHFWHHFSFYFQFLSVSLVPLSFLFILISISWSTVFFWNHNVLTAKQLIAIFLALLLSPFSFLRIWPFYSIQNSCPRWTKMPTLIHAYYSFRLIHTNYF